MVRVLQIRESGCSVEVERGTLLLQQSLGEGFECASWGVGPGGNHRSVLAAIRGVRRESFDVVHAWGLKALFCAAIGTKGKIVYTPGEFPGKRELGWMRAVLESRQVEVVCPTALMHRACVERGVAAEGCRVIRPGVEFGKVARRRNGELRKALGFGENDYVILAPGESTREAAHLEAVWGTAVLNYLDPCYKLLLWGRGAQAKGIQRFAKKICPDHVVVLAEQELGRKAEFEELLGAAEAVLVTARGPVATWPIAVCMAAALPIVSTVTPTVAELLEDRHTAAMVAKPSPRLIAQRVLDVRNDAAMQWSIADRAKTEAFEFFAATRFLREHRGMYRRMVEGEGATVQEEAPGAGRKVASSQ